MPRGLLVTVEGIDGSGKSTLAKALAARLADPGPVELTAEPTKTWLGEAVRRALVSDEPAVVDALLFLADHASHVVRVRALLEAGVTVVSDRWSDSTFAYQSAALAGEVPDPLAWLEAAEAPIDLEPDATILLDLPAEEAVRRLGGRAVREKFEETEFLDAVRRNYLARAATRPGRFHVLDARRPTADLVEASLAVVRSLRQPS